MQSCSRPPKLHRCSTAAARQCGRRAAARLCGGRVVARCSPMSCSPEIGAHRRGSPRTAAWSSAAARLDDELLAWMTSCCSRSPFTTRWSATSLLAKMNNEAATRPRASRRFLMESCSRPPKLHHCSTAAARHCGRRAAARLCGGRVVARCSPMSCSPEIGAHRRGSPRTAAWSSAAARLDDELLLAKPLHRSFECYFTARQDE
ncbi:hypothetical protein Dimus_036522 [Dionaea muscipula]